MTTSEKPYDAYVRVSRIAGRSGETFISPEVQRQQIEASAKAFGIEIGEVFEDLDVSGEGLDRPGLNEAMERIRDGVSGGIIVARLDRLSRAGVGDALKLVEEIHDHGAKLAAIDLGVDPTTPAGELMMTLMLALGRMERRRIGDNWRIAQVGAIKRGVYIAAKKPTGYKADESGRLVPNEYADEIREVFRMRAAGASWVECCKYLNEHEVVGPWGKSNWQGNAVAGIVKNRAYLGESRFGSDSDLVNKVAHEPLIDLATWNAAQRAPMASVPRSGEGLLLSGFIRCAGCRYLMKPGHINLRGKRVIKYNCGKQYAGGKCSRPVSVLGHVIEPYVIAHFKALVGSPEFAQHQDDDELDALRAELEAAEQDVADYRDEPGIIKAIGMASYVEGLEARQAVATEFEARIESIRPQSTSNIDLLTLFDDGSVEDKRNLLRSVIGSVFIRNLGKRAPIEKRAVILSPAELPSDLPRRGKRTPLKPLEWS